MTVTQGRRPDAKNEHLRKLEALFSSGQQGGSEQQQDGDAQPHDDQDGEASDAQARSGGHRPGGGTHRDRPGLTLDRRFATRGSSPKQVFSNPRRSLGRSPSEYSLRLARLQGAQSDEDVVECTDAFLEHHQLPDDVGVLYKVLRHTSEKVIREALGQISSLIMQRRISSTMLLEDRLQDLAKRCTEDATMSYIKGVSGQVAQLKAEAEQAS